MALIALTQFAGVEVIAFVMAAVGTNETIRPAQIEQGFKALSYDSLCWYASIRIENNTVSATSG